MKIDLASMIRDKKAQVALDFSVQMGPIDYYGDPIEIPSPVQVKGTLYVMEGKAFISCTIQALLEMDCGRCLKPAFYELKEKIDGELVREGQQLAETEEPDDIIFYQEDQIDLESLVRETILMNVPFQMLCSPDCKGICPQCGNDLNLQPCRCGLDQEPKQASVDPRFAKLKELLKDQ